MAASHRKFLVHPTTDEIFSWHVVETKTNQIISYHRNLRLALDKAERLNVVAAATLLLREARTVEAPRCGYQDDRYSYPCSAPATVSTMSININCIMKILSAPLGCLSGSTLVSRLTHAAASRGTLDYTKVPRTTEPSASQVEATTSPGATE